MGLALRGQEIRKTALQFLRCFVQNSFVENAKNLDPTPEVKQQLDAAEKAHAAAVEKLAKKRKAAEAKLKRAKARILRADKDKERQQKRDETDRTLTVGLLTLSLHKNLIATWHAGKNIPTEKQYLFPEFYPTAKRPKRVRKQKPKAAEISAS